MARRAYWHTGSTIWPRLARAETSCSWVTGVILGADCTIPSDIVKLNVISKVREKRLKTKGEK